MFLYPVIFSSGVRSDMFIGMCFMSGDISARRCAMVYKKEN